MSKSVSRSEAEDVLSSVLRLVKENKKPKPKAQNPTEKLVLTPQLRVSGPEVLRLTEESKTVASQASEPPSHRTDQSAFRKEAQAPKAGQSAAAPASKVTPPLSPDELSAKINALETVIARTAGQWEPDGPSREAYAGTTPPAIDWRDTHDLDATGQPVAPEADAEHDAALRRLVAEVVRAELRGDLGKLMTRNVRKLVLEEIQRALMAQPRD